MNLHREAYLLQVVRKTKADGHGPPNQAANADEAHAVIIVPQDPHSRNEDGLHE